MVVDIDEGLRRRAKTPHELAMVNLLLFNLLLCAGLLASTLAQKGSVISHYRDIAIAVPLGLSLLLIGYSFLRARRAGGGDPWFVAAHWRLATRRYRILLIAYLVGAALIGLGWLLSLSNPRLQEFMFLAFIRVAVAPMLITVMVIAVLESGSIYQAMRGEVPDALAQRFPPPADLLRQQPSSGEPASPGAEVP
jgi:hypothetical protein